MIPAHAAAFTITVDGDASDWQVNTPPESNTGIIRRDAIASGAWVWNDESGDERTDLSGGAADPEADIRRVAITSDSSFLYILIETSSAAPTVASEPLFQILVDTNRVAGTGNTYFMGFADTDVVADAAWEYAITTTFGAGGTRPRVWDTGNTDVASTGAANFRTGAITEIAVPWTDLGFTAGSAPTEPLRFAVASFHGDMMDNTADVGGPAISNALDVVTHYGTPGNSNNSWAELSDGVVDYYFDVWFHLDPDVEPSSPLLIAEVAYDTNATAEEFVEIVNVSGLALDLASYRLTDEEQIGGGEGAYLFPAHVLQPAQRLVVANEHTAFFAIHGIFPDFELTDTHPMVPELTQDSGWASGSITLSNGGDQLLVTDARDTILDVVTWEGGAWAGMTPHPGVSKGESIHRSPERRDRDDNSADFVALSTPAPAEGDSPCIAGDLTTRAAGADCDDNDPCTTGETCDAMGSCGAGTAVTCMPTADPCVLDVCDAVFRGCGGPEPTTTSCTDGDACTGPDLCDGAGACDNGIAITCPAPANVCESAVCDSMYGCNAAPGTACNDGELCTENDVCDGAGVCGGGDQVDCSAEGDQCNTGVCNADTGLCEPEPVLAGTPCDDGDPCTEGEICQQGQCYGGAWVCGGDVADMDMPDLSDASDAADMSSPDMDSPDMSVPDMTVMEPEDVGEDQGSLAELDMAEPPPPDTGDEGCGCRVRRQEQGHDGPAPYFLMLAILGLVWHTSRRIGPRRR